MVLKSYGGTLHDPEAAAPDTLDGLFLTLTIDEREEYMHERYIATLFLSNLDNHRFKWHPKPLCPA